MLLPHSLRPRARRRPTLRIGPRVSTAALSGLIAAACASSTGSLADGPAAVRPSRGDSLGAAVDRMLTRFAERGMAGNVLLFRDDRLVLARAVNPPTIPPGGRPIGLGDQFDMGSVMKTFTAAAVLQLAAEGRLSPADSLGDYVADLPPDRAGITLHHLLTHTSGYPLDAPDAGVPATAGWPEVFAAARTSRLLFPAGQSYSYSNYGYSLLAAIVERVSGQAFEEYVRERLVRPAGMRHSRLYGDSLPDARMAPGFRLDASGLVIPDTVHVRGKPGGVMWGKYALGAGGMISTVHDIAIWWAALHSDAVLGARERDRMFMPQEGLQGYGWNVNTTADSIPRIYRGGARGGHRSLLAYYPGERVLLVYAVNSDAGWDGALWSGVERLLARKSPAVPPAVATRTLDALRPYAGTYALPGGESFEVRERIGPAGPELVVAARGQAAISALRLPGHPSTEYDAENAGTTAIVAALVAGAPLPGSFHVDTASIRRDWLGFVDATGPVDSTRVIGSLPLPAPRPRVQTLIALHGRRGSVTVRLGWQEGRSFGFGGIVPVGPQYAFIPSAGGAFTSFEPSTGTLRTIRFPRRRSARPHALEILTAEGNAAAVANRSPRGAGFQAATSPRAAHIP